MGRKGTKGRRMKGASDDERFDDDFSGSEASFMSSEIGYATGEEGGVTKVPTSDFSGCLDKLSEKRASTREEGLRELTSGLRSYAFVEEVTENRETVMTSILNLVKKASSTEGSLCAEALGLLLLVLGPEEDELFKSIVAPLEFSITRSRYEDVRIESVKAISIGCFISCSEEEGTIRHARFMDALFSGNSEGVEASDELKAAAVDAWALLATVAPRSYHTGALRERLLSTFLTLLDSPSAELKLAAGEALAFLNEHWRGSSSEAFNYPEDEAVLVDIIIDKLQELAREGSKKMSKRDKKQQRSSFREVYAAVAENEPPEEVISFRTRSFRLTSWAKLKQMEALRDCLQGGFLTHLQMNPVIHDIFQIPAGVFDVAQERSVVEKNSEMGKLRTNARTRSRKSRENAKSLFLEGEEDGEG